MRILKFGGSSVASPERIKDVIQIVKNRFNESSAKRSEKEPYLVVVVSAQAGVTDQLINLCRTIYTYTGDWETIVQQLERRHLETLKSLLPIEERPAAMAEVISMCNELYDITKGAFLVGEVTPRTRDLILSYGERLSAYVISRAIKYSGEIKGDVLYTDARQLIRSDDSFGSAKVDFDVTNKQINQYYADFNGISVATGFIASTAKGQTTTLGRSGSDYSASIFGAALNAEIIEIWTDVDGVMTADPRYVKEAQSISQLSYNEAMELSHFGAKVIFPAAMQPAMAKHIPMLVKNTMNPDHKGTLICNESVKGNGYFKGITSLENISLVNVEGAGMVGVTGVAARMFTALSQHRINVILISQASSEHSICIAVLEENAEKARQLLTEVFATELASGLIGSVNSENGLALIAVVGENMRHEPGVAARVFGPLGRNGINIKTISQGSSELNISFAIKNNEMKKTLRILHQSLFKKEMRQINLFFAQVAQNTKKEESALENPLLTKLLEIIDNQRESLLTKKIELQLYQACSIDEILDKNLENSVYIDITDKADSVSHYEKLMLKNIAVVTSNKEVNSQNPEQYNNLMEISRKRDVPFYYNASIGAGLPVMGIVDGIKAGGDEVIKAEAIFSDKVNKLISMYEGDKTYSELVKEFKTENLHEDNFMIALSGEDLARKCLGLSRECGLNLDRNNISVESMVPEPGYDLIFNNLYSNAIGKGKRLRYTVTIEGDHARVSLRAIHPSDPLFSSDESENCIVLTTKYYSSDPLVIKGPGNDSSTIAASLLSDIVRIAENIRS